MSSLKELKGGYNYKTLNSPKKVDRAVRCAVLTKSPLRDNGKGAMFSMTLCDRDTSSTMRGVSFEEKLFDKFEPTKTYDLKAFKVKRGFRGEEIEMLLPENVEVNMALVQYPIEKRTFTIAQILRRETANVRFFTVKAKVIYIDDAQMVGKAPNDKLMREVQLGDTTGTIILVLWRRRAELESLNFKEDNVVVIENAVSSTFSGNVVISTAEETTINATNDEMNLEMSSENAASPCKKSKISCIETSVSAVKDFKCECRCVNCRRDIDWLASSTGGTASCSSGDEDLGFVKCPGCNTILRADAGKIRNECKLLLSYNNAWFLASSGVSFLFEFTLIYLICAIHVQIWYFIIMRGLRGVAVDTR